MKRAYFLRECFQDGDNSSMVVIAKDFKEMCKIADNYFQKEDYASEGFPIKIAESYIGIEKTKSGNTFISDYYVVLTIEINGSQRSRVVVPITNKATINL